MKLRRVTTAKTRTPHSIIDRPSDQSKSINDILRDALPAANTDDDEFATVDAEIEHAVAREGGSAAEWT